MKPTCILHTFVWSFILFILLPSVCIAQEEMDTDRPNQTYSPQTVEKGFFQIETGFQFHRLKQGGSKTDSMLFPTTALRIGVAKNMEVRLFEQAIRRKTTKDDQTSDITGIDNLRIGVKAKLFDQKGILPEFGILAYGVIPTGGDFRNHQFLPELRLLFSNEINDKVSLSYNLGWEGDDDMKKGIGIYTFVLQFQLTEKLKIFVENFGEYENLEEMTTTVDTEVMYLLFPNFQLDASIGKNLNEAHHYFDVGFSLRLPK